MSVERSAESVCIGHPDKLCDLIADHILDDILTLDPTARVAVEVMESDAVLLISDATLFEFCVLQPQFHNARMRTVAGRLKSDFRYSVGVVYNNFVWPESSDQVKDFLIKYAQEVHDARAKYPDATLADMYDPENDFLYPELTKAHKDLDAAVEKAYGVDFSDMEDSEREQAIVAHLLKLYNEKTAK